MGEAAAMIPVLKIDYEAQCQSCGELGATPSGLCLSCVTAAVRTEKIRREAVSRAKLGTELVPMGDDLTVQNLLQAAQEVEADRIDHVLANAELTSRALAWMAGFLILRVDRERLWSRWQNPETGNPYSSLTEWGRVRLHRDKSTISRLRKSAGFVCDRETKQRDGQRWLDASPYALHTEVIELAKKDPDAAHELATAARTEGQRRTEAKSKLPDQHHETGYRTFTIGLSEEAFRELRKTLNCARHGCEVPFPSEAEALSRICADFLAGWEPGATWEAERRDSGVAAQIRDDIEAGRCTCVECGAWWPIQYHHVIPRSHPIAGKDPDGSEWPRVPLCEAHHRQVTQAEGGTWREYLLRWMARDEALRGKVQQFLAGRRLEDV